MKLHVWSPRPQLSRLLSLMEADVECTSYMLLNWNRHRWFKSSHRLERQYARGQHPLEKQGRISVGWGVPFGGSLNCIKRGRELKSMILKICIPRQDNYVFFGLSGCRWFIGGVSGRLGRRDNRTLTPKHRPLTARGRCQQVASPDPHRARQSNHAM